MICKICGTPIPEDREYCDACQERRAASAPAAPAEPVTGEVVQKKRPSSMKGILSLVFGGVSAMPTFVGYFLTVFATASLGVLLGGEQKAPLTRGECDAFALVGLVLAVVALAMTVVAIVLGAMAIRLFVRAKRERLPKPIPGFVMGIVGLSMGSFFALCNLISLLLSFIFLMMSTIG